MKNFKLLSLLTVAVLMGVGRSKDDLQSETENHSVALKGTTEKSPTDKSTLIRNGAPSGAHYNLNIIGVPKNKIAEITRNNGGRIFVPLFGNTKILLKEGPDYAVLDANGTDGSASFRLPNLDSDGDGVSSYSIYARALDASGGSATITTCANAHLTDGYYEVCSAESLTVTRSKGGTPKFSNVSTELLTILITEDITAEGVLLIKAGRYFIFDDALEDYFWNYDSTGLKLLQLRFYETPTDVTP